MKAIGFLFFVMLATLAVVFGEFDDSPGLQGLGLILILFTLFSAFKHIQAKRHHAP